MIGLLDYDWCVSNKTSVLIPNIEIMKLASYYKTEENTFCRLLSLEEDVNELNNYDKIFFFSEIAENPKLPSNFLRASNVVYGGTAFTKGEYIPFKEELIDYTLARPIIYKEFLKTKYIEGTKAKVISHVLDDSYYRMHAGDKILPIPPIQLNKRLYLFDREIFSTDWENVFKKISARKPSSIIAIHPIICKTLTQFFSLRNYPKFSRTNSIILDLDVPTEDIYYLLKQYKKLFLADISFSSNVFLQIGGDLKVNNSYYVDMIYKLNLLYSFWSKGIPIKIKFKKPSIGVHNPLYNLSCAIESWCDLSRERNQEKTLDNKIIKKTKKTSEMEEKELLLKFYPSAKRLFNQSFKQLFYEGRWNL